MKKRCMGLTLLIDFGSTYTKITAVDLERDEVVARTQAVSTVETDMTVGLQKAYAELLQMIAVDDPAIEEKIACSSAAGGLRLAAIGLVPELTTEAAKQAAFGAGGKVVGVFSYQLNRRELADLERLSPDIILLTGGTDGGNRDVIEHNAKKLSESSMTCPIVVAGNKVAADAIESILKTSGKEAIITENVLPELGRLNVEPARDAIREVYMERIVRAKGLDKAEKFVGGVLMPTPMAVLKAAKLLAEGTTKEKGIGDLVVIDVGGTTTDIESVCSGKPTQPGVVEKGLPEPYAKRTVEGDLGIRYNAPNILDLAGAERILGNTGAEESSALQSIDLQARVSYLATHIGAVPVTDEDFCIDIGLARTAVDRAMERHAGTIELFTTPLGNIFLQRGKDLTAIGSVIGTGGIFAYGRQPRWVLEGSRCNKTNLNSLRPRNPDFFIDQSYILYAVGLLSELVPESALRIAKKYLKKV